MRTTRFEITTINNSNVITNQLVFGNPKTIMTLVGPRASNSISPSSMVDLNRKTFWIGLPQSTNSWNSKTYRMINKFLSWLLDSAATPHLGGVNLSFLVLDGEKRKFPLGINSRNT